MSEDTVVQRVLFADAIWRVRPWVFTYHGWSCDYYVTDGEGDLVCPSRHVTVYIYIYHFIARIYTHTKKTFQILSMSTLYRHSVFSDTSLRISDPFNTRNEPSLSLKLCVREYLLYEQNTKCWHIKYRCFPPNALLFLILESCH